MKKKPPRKVKNDIHKLLRDLDEDPKHLKQTALDRMIFIQDMIELVHIHGHNETRFAKLVTDEVQIETLKKRGIIDIEYHAALLEANGVFLSETELELSCLLYNGFSTHILRRIYAHSNPDSIYIRIHRVRTKIHRQISLKHEKLEYSIDEY